jgi:hypothetical protein
MGPRGRAPRPAARRLTARRMRLSLRVIVASRSRRCPGPQRQAVAQHGLDRFDED